MTEPSACAWSVAVFTARERVEDLERTLAATLRSTAEGPGAVIDVLVNGNARLADEAAALAQRMEAGATHERAARLRVWYIALGDKAHAWNQYLHDLWPGAGVAFFIDGYVRLKADALRLIDEGLAASPRHMAATGVPSVGRTAAAQRRAMLEGGGIHGNLYALKGTVMERLRSSGFRLPLGLYRTDPTLGAALAFGLDPRIEPWDPKGRILVHPQATWVTDEKRVFSRADLTSQWKRVLRQGQGTLENRAVKAFFAVQRRLPEELPATTAAMVADWSQSSRGEFIAALVRHPLSVPLALRELRAPRDWSAAAVAPANRHPAMASYVDIDDSIAGQAVPLPRS